MPKILRMFGFWSWAAALAWSITFRARSAWVEIPGWRRRMVTIFSRPAAPSLAARCSVPRPVASVSSRRTSFPNFSLLGILVSEAREPDARESSTRVGVIQQNGGGALAGAEVARFRESLLRGNDRRGRPATGRG